MDVFLQQTVDGLAVGALYGLLGLALVLIFRSTGLINFAQGEFALLSTYLAFSLTVAGIPLWAAGLTTMAIGFMGAAIIQLVVIRRVDDAPHLAQLITTLALFLVINGFVAWAWGFRPRVVPSLFPTGVIRIGDLRFVAHSIGTLLVLLLVMFTVYAIFKWTRFGLVLRAVSSDRDASRLVGIRVGPMLMVGWGLAASLGTVVGLLIAPRLLLDPTMMFGVLVYSIAAVALGGFDSPGGAVLGGLIIGVAENLGGTYVGWIGADLKITVPLAILVGVLLVRPAGLFGTIRQVRV